MVNYFKSIISLSTFLVALPALAVCQNKIDKSKVILFIDTNKGELEIESARKAACARGEQLQIVPNQSKELIALQNKAALSRKSVQDCYGRDPNGNSCEKLFQAFSNAITDIQKYAKTQPPFVDQVKQKLLEIKKLNAKITNVTISGHDGGGIFHGDKGSFSRQQLSDMMIDFPGINQVESVLLLGCYTGVSQEVYSWQSSFPKLRLVAGYDGSAPNSERPLGHAYIQDILKKEKQLLKLPANSNIDKSAKSLIQGLGDLNSAMYIAPYCATDTSDGFYYASMKGRQFSKMDPGACHKAEVLIKEFLPLFYKYQSGELEPPKNTANGELRSLYNFVQTNRSCEVIANAMPLNQVFNLLFWDGVKKNYSEYYKKDLDEAEQILSGITPESMMKNIKLEIEDVEKQIKLAELELSKLPTDPELYKLNLEKEYAELASKYELAAKETREIFQKGTTLSNMSDDEKKKIHEFQKIQYDFFQLENVRSFRPTLEKAKESISFNVASFKHHVETKRSQMNEGELSKMIKSVWIPNKKNLETKSRKEVIQNLSSLHSLMASQSLSSKQSGALNFLKDSADTHFQYMNNPFSWHEYTGRVEAPNYPMSLGNYIQNTNSGIGGGQIGGSYGGGGAVGGYVPTQQVQQQYQQPQQQPYQPQQQQPQQH